MPLQKRTIAFQCGGGLDTKPDRRWLEPGKWREVRNGWFDKTGRVRKRFGVTAISRNYANSNSVVNNGVDTIDGLYAFREELIASGKANLWSRTPAATNAPWGRISGARLSVLGHAIPEIYSVHANRNDHTCPAVAYKSGIVWSAWELNSGIEVAVQDWAAKAGIPHVSFLAGAGASQPKFVVTANWVTLWYTDGTALKYARWNPATPNVSATIVTVVGVDVAGPYDIIADSNGTNDLVYYCYHNSASGVATAGRWDVANGVVSVAAASLAVSGNVAVGWHVMEDWSGASVYLTAASSVSGVVGKTITKATMAVTATNVLDGAATVVRNVTGLGPGLRDNGSAATAYWELPGTSAHLNVVRRCDFGGVAADARRSVGLAGKPFKGPTDDVWYLPCAYDSTFQACYVLLAISSYHNGAYSSLSHRGCARILYGDGGGQTARTASLPFIMAGGTNEMLWPVMKRSRLETDDADTSWVFTRGMAIAALQWDPKRSSRPREFNDRLYLPGSWGEVHPTEANLDQHCSPLFPEQIPTITPSTTTGSLTPTGVYSYVAVFAAFDAKTGQVVRSAPSTPKQVTMGATDNRNTLTLYTNRLASGSLGAGVIEVYRTEASGLTYYRVTSLANAGSPNGVVNNTTTADTVGFVDDMSDATLLTQEPLYTTGGILDAHLAPPSWALEPHAERLFALSSEDGSLWYSQKAFPGVPAQFNPKQKIFLSNSRGRGTALLSMDDKLLIFYKDGILALTGDGPDRLGRNPYTQPQLVAEGAGSRYPRSIVLTPLGAMFKGERGFWLLTRGMALEYIGAPVEEFNGLTVTGVSLLTSLSQVRWTTSDDRTLVYDYSNGQWSTFTNQTAGGGSAVRAGTWCYAAAGGTLYEETTAYDDAGSFISLLLITPPLSLAGLAGVQRVYRARLLANYVGAHRLYAGIKHNYSDAALDEQLKSIVPGPLIPLGRTDFECEVRPAKQKNSSLEVKIYDQADFGGGNTGGYTLAAIAVEFGVRPGLRRLPRSRNMT